MNKKKIVHIAQANGGVEVYLKMFFKYMDTDAYENYLILSQQYIGSKNYFEKIGIKVYIVDMQREISLKNDFKAMCNIYSILKKINPDIVYTHSSKAGGLGRIPAKIIGAINIYNPHGWAFDMNLSNKKRALFKYMEKFLGYFTDQVIAISQYEKDIAIKYNVLKEKKITVVENAIDLDNFNISYDSERIINELGWDKDSIIIGMIARISEQKSPHTFVDIAIKLSQQYPKCRFLMVGDGDQREEIENKIRENNLEFKFHITGWIDNPYQYLSVFDIALLTSKWEGFGMVIPEYMAAGKPVIASNVGGIANIIEDKKNGYIIDNLDVEQFVRKIQCIIEDENLKRSLIQSGYETAVLKYDFRRNIKEHMIVFNGEIKKRSSI